MKTINDVVADFMAKKGVKDEHFISPHGWKEIAVLFAKEASKEQRVICSEEAVVDYGSEIDKESILNAKSPV